MREPEDRYFESSRLRLHYAVWGDESKPPLVLVHGGRDHARSWDFVAQQMVDRYCVYAVDLRGHGDSQWSLSANYATSAYVYDLAQLIHQQHLAPCRIVAHSLGGSIALRYAGAFPENVIKLVSIEGLGPSPTMMAERAQRGPVRNVFTRTGIWTNVQRGTWVEFASGAGAKRARLTWISPNKGVYLFTNPLSGTAAVSISPEALAEQMRLGEARMLDDAPLTDRAVDSMLATLREGAAAGA